MSWKNPAPGLFEEEEEVSPTAAVRARVAFIVTGPNCSGKTTAVRGVRQLFAGDDRVRFVHMDPGDFLKKDIMAERLERVWLSPVGIVVAEGVDAGVNALAVVMQRHPSFRNVECLCTQMSGEVMRDNLIRRCLDRGKAFRDDCWTIQKCAYYGERKYAPVMARLRAAGASVSTWRVGPSYDGQKALAEHLESRIRECLGVFV